MKRFVHFMLGFAVFLPLAAMGQSMGSYPGTSPSTTFCKPSVDAAYARGMQQGTAEGTAAGYQTGLAEGTQAGLAEGTRIGYAQGQQDGYAEGNQAGLAEGTRIGYAQGRQDGYAEGNQAGLAERQKCIDDPASCDITLASCLPPPRYGETEQNDSMVTADRMVLGEPFWGQSYGPADQDWFYIVTTKPNQNLTFNFSVPGTTPGGWKVSLRDSRGTVFADFDTAVKGPIASPDDSVTYSATLGLAGTYYLVVQSKAGVQNFSTYLLAAALQDSPLTTWNPIAGFFDTEREPNDLPSEAVAITNGVAMYGLINLTFQGTVEQDGEDVWGQGEDDWFVYSSPGKEMIEISLCAKEACGPGEWFVRVYDQAGADTVGSLIQAGQQDNVVKPLLSFNTNNAQVPLENFRLGLGNAGRYYIRIDHKRLFNAPCREFRMIERNGQFTSGVEGLCTCDSEGATDPSQTGSSCFVPPLTAAAGAKCQRGDLLCKINSSADCIVGIDPGCGYTPNNPPGCTTDPSVAGKKQAGIPLCTNVVPPNCTKIPSRVTEERPWCEDWFPVGCTTEPEMVVPEQEAVELCDTFQYLPRCSCSIFGGVVQVPEGAYSSPYNFTLHGNGLPNTSDSNAYQDFLDRPSIYGTGGN